AEGARAVGRRGGLRGVDPGAHVDRSHLQQLLPGVAADGRGDRGAHGRRGAGYPSFQAVSNFFVSFFDFVRRLSPMPTAVTFLPPRVTTSRVVPVRPLALREIGGRLRGHRALT